MLLAMSKKRFIVGLFSGYVASVEDPAWDFDFKSKEDFWLWLDEAVERSAF